MQALYIIMLFFLIKSLIIQINEYIFTFCYKITFHKFQLISLFILSSIIKWLISRVPTNFPFGILRSGV